MNAFLEFLRMGGYAFYVWSAYGIALLVLGANILWPLRRTRLLRRQLAGDGRALRSAR